MKWLPRLAERIELWIRHRLTTMPYTTYCYYCNVAISAPGNEIFAAVRSHNEHPAHKAAARRAER